MNDFEVNPIGYAEEVRLSRELVNKIIDNYEFDKLHPDVALATMKLMALYERQQLEGIQ